MQSAMTKRFLIIFLSVIFLLAGLISPLANNAFSAPASSTPVPAPDSIELAPNANHVGFYLANNQWHMLSPADYSAVGTFQFWSWESLNPDRNLYRFDKIDSYIDAAVAAGYQSVGIAITTYNGRSAQYYPCTGEFNQGYAQTPYFVRWGPDGVEGTSDDAAIIADDPDSRDCDGDGTNDPWLLPYYTHSYYKQQYQQFVEALANHLLNSPRRNRVAWVALGTGKDGENIPVNNGDDDSLLRVISASDWVGFVEDVIDIYHDAFSAGASKPQIPMLVQNAPAYRYTWERRDIAAYANSKDMGLSVNGITSDFDLTEACDSGDCLGMYDQVHLYGDNVPIGLESYAYMMGSENEFYWAMARAGDLKSDFLRISSFWDSQDTPVNRTIARWISRYIGKGWDTQQDPPPSIWSRLREHRDPIYLPYVSGPATANYWPPVGNYEYYLIQDHAAPHGVTIPITDDPRFQASDHRIGWDGTQGQPAHYNAHPYSAILNSAGLYHVESVKQNAVEVQIEVDPGWTARRSDRATDNYGFFFNADDRYLSAPANINKPHEIRITVTYLDHGDDRWRLMYDSTSGEKAATLYALQDWNVATGLAVDDGLPTSGVLPDPKPTYVQKSNTNHWKVATFYIRDGYFNNRLAGGNDFYIDSRNEAGVLDGDEYIHHVDVQKLNDTPQITPTPTTTPPAITPTPTATPGAGDSISGFVFENKNGDYTKDPDEPGLPGALVELYRANDFSTPLRQTATDNNGAYIFSNVSPGTYSIIVSPPAGWEMILASRYVVLQSGQSLIHQDFPARRAATTPTPTATPTATPTVTPTPTATPPPSGQFNGFVWNDVNKNRRQDAGEPPLAGAEIIIFDDTGQNEIDRKSTGGDGYARFTLPAPASYVVREQPPFGMGASTTTEYAFILHADAAIEIIFGNYDNNQKVYLPMLAHPSQ